MKKILLISYYFPPCNSIGSIRPESFAKNFAKYGLYPTVITRHWKGDENAWEDFLQTDSSPQTISEDESYRLIKLPYFGRSRRIIETASRFKPADKAVAYYMTATGVFSPELNAYEGFYEFLRGYLRENPHDYILATSPPINSIKLASRLAKEFKIPYIIDFRDLWNIHLTKVTPHQERFGLRMYHNALEYHLKNWLKDADLIISVSEPLLEEISRLAKNNKKLLVTNGFEADLFDENKSLQLPKNSKFTFSVIGSLFSHQDLTIMFDGLNKFLSDKNLNEIQLNFIGSAYHPQIADEIAKRLPKECTFVTGRIPRSQAIEKTMQSDVLFYPAWRGYKGIVSGKIFEYLGSGRNILIAPGDGDVIENIIQETNSGKIADSVEEFTQIMNAWFAEWKKQGFLQYHGKRERINFYTRENQAKILSEFILKL